MSKRRRGNGINVSIDRFPQFMVGDVIQTGADVDTAKAFPTPIPRIGTMKKATIMELLWIVFELPSNVSLNAAAENLFVQFYGGVTEASPSKLTNVSATIASWGITSQGVNTGTLPGRYVLDLQSRDGYGFLFAGDKINCNVLSTNTGVANTIRFRIYYRFVEVPLQEYLGIIQSLNQG